MNIHFLEIKKDKAHSEEIKKLYHSAFPSDERAPYRMLMRGAKKENIDFLFFLDVNEWIGMIYVVNYLDMSYVFHFAVHDKKRGNGYGTAILRAAQKKYSGRRLFLAIEEVDEKYDNYKQRTDRLKFYERAGFIRTGQKMQEGKVIYDLMGIGGRVSNKEYRRLIRSFAGLVLLFFTMRIIED